MPCQESITPFTIFLCGELRRAEFLEIVDSLTRQVHFGVFAVNVDNSGNKAAPSIALSTPFADGKGSASPDKPVEIQKFIQLSELLARIDANRNSPENQFDLLILFQSFPGQFSCQDILRLRYFSPIAPQVLIAGPLCEGEGRTGTPLPGMIRFYWHQWKDWGQEELRKFLSQKTGRFSLPATAGDDDYFHDRFSPLPKRAGFSPAPRSSLFQNLSENNVILAGGDTGLARLLQEIFRKKEIDVPILTWKQLLDREKPVSQIFLDAPNLSLPEFRQQIETLKQRFPDAVLDIFAFEPQIDEIQALNQTGFVRVHSQPFLY